MSYLFLRSDFAVVLLFSELVNVWPIVMMLEKTEKEAG